VDKYGKINALCKFCINQRRTEYRNKNKAAISAAKKKCYVANNDRKGNNFYE
jgi:hypothetical protein